MKLQCPKCRSENLRYYENRAHAFEISDDLTIDEVSHGPLMEEEKGHLMQVECQDCYLTSDDSKELKAIRDRLVKKNDRYNT